MITRSQKKGRGRKRKKVIPQVQATAPVSLRKTAEGDKTGIVLHSLCTLLQYNKWHIFVIFTGAVSRSSYNSSSSTMGQYVEFCEQASLPITAVDSISMFLTLKSHENTFEVEAKNDRGETVIKTLQGGGVVSRTTTQLVDQLLCGARLLTRLGTRRLAAVRFQIQGTILIYSLTRY